MQYLQISSKSDLWEGVATWDRFNESGTKLPRSRRLGCGWKEAAKSINIFKSLSREEERRNWKRGGHLILRQRWFCCCFYYVVYDDDNDDVRYEGIRYWLEFETFFYQNSFSLFQPIDVSHIYEPDLHERRQKRLPKNNKKGPEVRPVLVQIQLHSVSLKSSLTRDFHMLTIETLITSLTIENLNSWQSLLPDNQEWQWTAFAILAMFSPTGALYVMILTGVDWWLFLLRLLILIDADCCENK